MPFIFQMWESAIQKTHKIYIKKELIL
jgi:hypothetical protein